MDTGVPRALRPGRGAPRRGELLDLPLLQLIGEIGEPVRGKEADLDADAPGTGAVRRLDPGAHAVRLEVAVCLLEDVGTIAPLRRMSRRTGSRFARSSTRSASVRGRGLLASRHERSAAWLDCGDQLLLVIEEPAAV